MDKQKLIYDIKEAVRAYSKDAKLTDAYVLHLINTHRADFIRQHQRRNPGEDKSQFTQTLLLELENVDRGYIANIPLDVTILRTKKKLPRLIGKDILNSIEVRAVDRVSQGFEYMAKTRAIYGADSRYIFVFLEDDGRLYFTNRSAASHKFITNVAVTGILEEPEAIVEANNLTAPLLDYPIPAAMWSTIRPIIRDVILGVMQVPIDVNSDNQTVQ